MAESQPRLRRLSIRLNREPAMEATRVSIAKQRSLVYVPVADKRLRYRKGLSRIAYIGTTKRGSTRVASSIAGRAPQILTLRGVRKFHARIVTCQPRQNVATWPLLERALLIAFKARFGEVPKCNVHGKRMRERDEFKAFSRRRIASIIDELS